MRGSICVPVVLLALCGLASADQGELTKDTVEFAGKKLFFAFEGNNPGETFREYIPAGQKLDSWTELASIRKYPELHSIPDFVGSMVRSLKRTNPSAKSAILENEATGEVVLDFVTWPADGSFVEFNVWKFSESDHGGILAVQYAVRNYDDPTGFMKSLRPLRLRLVDLMATEGIKVEE